MLRRAVNTLCRRSNYCIKDWLLLICCWTGLWKWVFHLKKTSVCYVNTSWMCGFFSPLPLREWSLRPQQWRLLPGSHPSAFALGARFFLLLQWGRVLRCRRVLPDQYFSQTLHRVSTVAGPVHPTPPGCSRHCPEVALMPETLESNAVNVVLLAASHRWLSSAASAKTREEEKEAALPRCLTLSAFLSVLFFSHLYLLSIILLVIFFNIFLPLFSCLSSFSFIFLLLSFFPSALFSFCLYNS